MVGVQLMKAQMTHEEQKERIRQRVHVKIDEQHYEYFPETEHTETYDNDTCQRVGIYVRVSTDDVHQSMSYELQKKYYEDFVVRHPKWKLVGIYADEGISGTSLKHRDEFNRMIADARAGKLDLIITKSVSRFARNVVDFLGMVRMLSEHHPRIGVFFESECIYSLNERSQMALSFQATMAEEESRNKSRSMETSLRMRLDHGLPLTPKLLGFTHDEYGKLVPDPETAHIPKLIFFMYLYGFSTQQIADTLTTLGKKTYLGNIKWTSSGIAQTLRNERYCGDVFTRKTYTPDVISHRSVKNRGQRPRSRYLDEHEAIISRDDFIAVQHMLQNAKYKNKSILPELQVIKDGLLKGYVIINPRWGAFTVSDYLRASASAYEDGVIPTVPSEVQVEVNNGDFDLRGFELARLDFFDMTRKPYISFCDKSLKFSSECFKRMTGVIRVEILVHPTIRKMAVRPASPEDRNAVVWGVKSGSQVFPRIVPCSAFFDMLYSMFSWNPDNRYRLYGTLMQNSNEAAYLFDANEPGVFMKASAIHGGERSQAVMNRSGKRVGVLPAEVSRTFGKEFFFEQSFSALRAMTKEQWKLRLEGQLFSTHSEIHVTGYDELRAYIDEQLKDIDIWGALEHD